MRREVYEGATCFGYAKEGVMPILRFKMTVLVEDREADAAPTVATEDELKKIYKEILNDSGYDISYNIQSIEDIQPQS